MSVLSLKFDPIDYARQLRSVGVSQEQADIHAQTMERVFDEVLTHQDLVTKKDLKKDLAELKLELIKWTLGTGVATIITLAGLLKYMH